MPTLHALECLKARAYMTKRDISYCPKWSRIGQLIAKLETTLKKFLGVQFLLSHSPNIRSTLNIPLSKSNNSKFLIRKLPVQCSSREKQAFIKWSFSPLIQKQLVSVPAVHRIDCSAVFHSTALGRKGMTGTAASADTSQMTAKITTLPLSTAAWR